MTARPKHTPEPWSLNEWNGLLRTMGPAKMMACVRACAGLNPEAIPALVEALALWDETGGTGRAKIAAETAVSNALAAVRGSK